MTQVIQGDKITSEEIEEQLKASQLRSLNMEIENLRIDQNHSASDKKSRQDSLMWQLQSLMQKNR